MFFSSSHIRVSQKVLESPGISKKVLEKSWKLECKSPGKSEKKSWKVLEFDIKFSVATLLGFSQP